MANEIRLEVYTFGIRKKLQKEIYETLDSFFEKNDFLKFFENYVNQNADTKIEKGTKRTIQFFNKAGYLSLDLNKRIISGVVKSGYWGTETEIISGLIKNGQETTEEERKTKVKVQIKGEEDIEIRPFYFLIYAPTGKSKGLLMLQRTGPFGINGIFTRLIYAFFKEAYSDYRIDFDQFLSKTLAKKLIAEGDIKTLTLRRYDLPKDIADYLGIKHNKPKDNFTIEFKVTANHSSKLFLNNKAKKFVTNPNNAFIEVSEMNKIGFNEDTETSITIMDGGHARTIDLSENMQLRPYYDIDKKVEKDKGNPVFNSIDKLAKELLVDLDKEMYPATPKKN
jgi:hypothetical protein